MLRLKKYEPHQHKWSPEIADGFDYLSKVAFKTNHSPLRPVSFFTLAKPGENYEIKLTIKAKEEVPELLLYTGRRQFRGYLTFQKGEQKNFTFYQSLTEIIPDFEKEKLEMSALFVTYCCKNPEAIEMEATAKPQVVRKLFLCGDSTVTDQVAPFRYFPEMAYTSWGQSLPAFLTGKFAIDNQAHSGNTSESFQKEGHFDLVKKWIRPNDYCLFQFGHNDQKIPHLLPQRDYRKNILKFVREIQSLQGIAVLVTPMGRNTWQNGDYNDLLLDYDQEIKALGQQVQVPVLSLHDKTVALWKQFGQKRSTDFFPKGDYTHTNDYGSYQVATLVAQELNRVFPDDFLLAENMPAFLPQKNRWQDFSVQIDTKDTKNKDSATLHTMEAALDELVETIETVKKK